MRVNQTRRTEASLSVPSKYTERPTAFNVESIRRRLFNDLAVPQDLLDEALRTTKKHLKATKKEFFTNRGKVVDEKIVEDVDAQLKAADQVYKIGGVYARERDSRPSAPAFAMEVDARTGIVRIIVGGDTHVDMAPVTTESALVELGVGDTSTGQAEASSPTPLALPPRDAVSRILFDETEP